MFGELSAELPTKALIRFLDVALARFPAMAIVLVHHTKKPSYTSEGKPLEEDAPCYGSQWLKAYVDPSYLLRASSGRKDHVVLINKKDRHSACLKELILHYDPESDTVSTDAPPGQQSGYERTVNYLKLCKAEGRTTDFYEVLEATGISTQHLRRIQVQLLSKGMLICDKFNGKKRIWEPGVF